MDLQPLRCLADRYRHRQAVVAYWVPRLQALVRPANPSPLSMYDYLLLRLDPKAVEILQDEFFTFSVIINPNKLDKVLAMYQRQMNPWPRPQKAFQAMIDCPSRAVPIFESLEYLDRDKVLNWCIQYSYRDLWTQLRPYVTQLQLGDRWDLLQGAISDANMEAVEWLRPQVELDFENPNRFFDLAQAILASNHYPLVVMFDLDMTRVEQWQLEHVSCLEIVKAYVDANYPQPEIGFGTDIILLVDCQLLHGRADILGYLLGRFPDVSLARDIFRGHDTSDGQRPVADLYHVLRSGNPELVALVMDNLSRFDP